MSWAECDIDSDASFWDYRERLLISDGNVTCLETDIVIPKGEVYACCEGISAYDNGSWSRCNQLLSVWRLVRNERNRTGACFTFGGIWEELSHIDYDCQESKLFKLAFNRILKRDTSKVIDYSLNQYERLALESGTWYEYINWKKSDRNVIGDAGLPWLPAGIVCTVCLKYLSEVYFEGEEDICEYCKEDLA